MLYCLLLVGGGCALAGCGSASTEAPSTSRQAVERVEHDEEAAALKREEDAEVAKAREVLSEIEAEHGEARVGAAQTKAKRIEAAARSKARKREKAAEARVKKLEEEEEAVSAELKRKRETLSKIKRQTRAQMQAAAESEAPATATAPQAGTEQKTVAR
jgi:hypothetical protein